jgi:hypothetical protein
MIDLAVVNPLCVTHLRAAQREPSTRGVGVLARPAFAAIDAATLAAFESINFNLDEGRRELARLV